MALNKQNPTKYFYCLSLCLILIGSTSMGYSYLMHPSLVPMYGGGENLYLDNHNNFTAHFPFITNSRLHIAVNANDTIQISINGEIVHTGTYYELEIEYSEEILMSLESFSPVSGRLTLRQDTPVFLIIFSFGCLVIGIISIFINWFFFQKKTIPRMNPKTHV